MFRGISKCVVSGTLCRKSLAADQESDLDEKVLQAPNPTNKQQLSSFLGLIGFYRKFIPNFATVAVPLTDLTKKDQPNQLNWGEAQNRDFETLKGYIVNPPILRLPDFEKQFI